MSRNFRDWREQEVGEDPVPPELLPQVARTQVRGSTGSRTLTSIRSGWCGDFVSQNELARLDHLSALDERFAPSSSPDRGRGRYSARAVINTTIL